MLCGRPPFAGNPWTVIARVANSHETPPPPRSVNADLPRDLEACCLKAMEKDPKERYPSLQALADDLDHWLKGLPLLARPIGPVERFVRWYRQNRMIASLGGAVAVLLLIAGTVGPWLAVRFRELAEAAKRDANAAKVARDEEKQARLATERSIIDSYTETGLTAHRNGDPREAILWFANAVAAAENYPTRERHNRIRLQSWLSQVATPVQAFDLPAAWKKSLTYHPSGRWLLSLAATGSGELLQISDGQRLPLPLNDSISAATFSPDGKWLVLASGPEVVVFEFDADRMTHAERDRWTHPDPVNDLQFSPDGQLLVVGGDDSVQVRDVTHKAFRTKPRVIGSQVLAAAVTPDGQRYAVRSADKKVGVFTCGSDSTNSEPLLSEPLLSEPLLPAQSANSLGKVAPLFVGNHRLVVCEDHEAVRCWDIDRKESVWSFKPTRVLALVLSPDEKWIAVAADGEVVLLDAATGVPSEQRMKHSNMVNNLSFHPTSSLLLTACIEHTAHVFEIPSGKPVGPPIPHCDAVHRCLWSPDGASFATVHWNGDLVRVWKPSHDQRQEEMLTANTARGPFVRIDSQGNRWMPSGFENWRDRMDLEVFDLKTGKTIGAKLSGPGLISDSDFIPKSPLVVLAGGSSRESSRLGLNAQKLDGPGFIRFVNLETGKPAFEDVPTPSQPIAVRSSPDGQTVVVLCHQGHVLLLETATGKPRAEHLAFDGESAVFGFLIRERIRFSNRGDQFVIWGCSSLAELRKTDTGERVAGIRHESGFIHDAQFSPDGKLVATCSSDHSVRLWNSATGSSAGAPLAHAGWVFSAEFSQDGRRLLTASSDKQARIWDLSTRTAILATREHTDQVFGVTFLPGEEHFLASTRDGLIAAYDSSLGKLIAPARQMPGKIFQLSRHAGSSRVIASGENRPMRGFDANQWILEPDMQLSRDDVRLLGEILSSQRVHAGGAATGLTSAEWFERWKKFREKHPDGSALQMSSPKSRTAD